MKSLQKMSFQCTLDFKYYKADHFWKGDVLYSLVNLLTELTEVYYYCKIFASTAEIVFPVGMPRLALVASHAALLRH